MFHIFNQKQKSLEYFCLTGQMVGQNKTFKCKGKFLPKVKCHSAHCSRILKMKKLLGCYLSKEYFFLQK